MIKSQTLKTIMPSLAQALQGNAVPRGRRVLIFSFIHKYLSEGIIDNLLCLVFGDPPEKTIQTWL